MKENRVNPKKANRRTLENIVMLVQSISDCRHSIEGLKKQIQVFEAAISKKERLIDEFRDSINNTKKRLLDEYDISIEEIETNDDDFPF